MSRPSLQTPGRTVVGCDIVNLLMLPLPYVLADGGALPFLDASFDAITLITVLHHVPKPLHARFFSQAARVLKPGGTLVLMEDTFHGGVERDATMFFDSVMNAEFAGHPHANRTLADWAALMTEAGLHVQQSFEQVAWYGIFRIRHGIVIGFSLSGLASAWRTTRQTAANRRKALTRAIAWFAGMLPLYYSRFRIAVSNCQSSFTLYCTHQQGRRNVYEETCLCQICRAAIGALCHRGHSCVSGFSGNGHNLQRLKRSGTARVPGSRYRREFLWDARTMAASTTTAQFSASPRAAC